MAGQKKGFNHGAYGRVILRAGDCARRVAEGTVSEERVMLGIQMLSEGSEPKAIETDPRLLSVDGLKRLVLEPDRPISSWREVLGIEARDWTHAHEKLFAEPEPWEMNLSEVWYAIDKPGHRVYSLEVANRLYSRGLHGFTPRMNFALARAERDLVMEHGPLVATGCARQSFDGDLGISALCVEEGRLCAYVGRDGYWRFNSSFGGFRKF